MRSIFFFIKKAGEYNEIIFINLNALTCMNIKASTSGRPFNRPSGCFYFKLSVHHIYFHTIFCRLLQTFPHQTVHRQCGDRILKNSNIITTGTRPHYLLIIIVAPCLQNHRLSQLLFKLMHVMTSLLMNISVKISSFRHKRETISRCLAVALS